MQRRLHRRQAEIHDLADFSERATEHIHQDHAGTLCHRQPHEGTQAGAGDLAAGDDVDGIGNHVHFLARPQRFLTVAPPQEIQRSVVRDPEQPAFGIADPACSRKRLHRLDQGILQHVLAVDHRADHARAIAMQSRAQAREQVVDISGSRDLRDRFHTDSGRLRHVLWLLQHSVISHDGRALHHRRLDAALANAVLERLEGREARKRAGRRHRPVSTTCTKLSSSSRSDR